jgi:hypothetical protein
MPELAAAARREQMPLHELAKGVKPLPYSTVLLLEEAETIATNAAERRDRSWFDNLFS